MDKEEDKKTNEETQKDNKVKEVEKITEEKEDKEKKEEEQKGSIEKPSETPKEEIPERIYTIPLREAYNQPWTKRARKAVRIVKEFLKRHTKQDIKLGNDVNQKIWARGMKKPPRRIRVKVKGDTVNLME